MEFPRRDFLRWTGMATIAGAVSPRTFFAGGSALNSEVLFDRGKPSVFQGEDLRFIGMPVGGICAGMVYLGGDGKLWLWDIFNRNQEGITQKTVEYRGAKLRDRDGASYVEPIQQAHPFDQRFTLSIDGHPFPLDKSGWSDIRFSGSYPVGRVAYADPKTKVTANLTAFSPFIPLNEDDSGLPVTLMTYRVHNAESHSVEIDLQGHLVNPIGLDGGVGEGLIRFNKSWSSSGIAGLNFCADLPSTTDSERPDILQESWESRVYKGWKAVGTAFGEGPIERSKIPTYQGNVGGRGDRVVNSHATAPGDNMESKDSAQGRLLSDPFLIERRYLNFWIGGGRHPGKTCLNLLVNGEVVRTATGHDHNTMRTAFFNVEEFASERGVQIEIVDEVSGPWGNIGVGQIWQSDQPASSVQLEKRPDYGTMTLAVFQEGNIDESGSVGYWKVLAPGETLEMTFAIAWHFPNLRLGIGDDDSRRYYSTKFGNAEEVIRYVFANRNRLMDDTVLWSDTWNDSTLPHWFLDRTFVNTALLATTTCHRFGTGRFYAWEGVGACEGTCAHVWHYAQAMGRLFPALERVTREKVDYGVGFHPDTGGIGYRAEFNMTPAADGQAGTILRTYREHQMSADDRFLRRLWPRVKQAVGYLVAMDRGDGLLDGAQENTLDAAWYGQIAWISSLYAAALRAGEEMAREMGDEAFASDCHARWQRSKASLESKLFNGEYFIQTRDPKHPEALGTYDTCHIDQVQGQSWAWQVGLGRILDRRKTVTALRSLYKHNYVSDVGPFRDKFKEGRWYAMPGEAGLVMVTNPRNLPNPYGDVGAWQYGYFNECMTGFEHQAASHMIAEGMVEEGFRVTKAIHDRYAAHKRNPFNEIECGDHYARSMASYGSFVSACGFTYHGPKGHIGFAPRLSASSFRAAFTTAEGWGTYDQRRSGSSQNCSVAVKWGRVRLIQLSFELASISDARVEVTLGGKAVPATLTREGSAARVVLQSPVVVKAGESLVVRFYAS